jgi:hypothetical protein
MAGNPVKYTSRTFQTIMADINADPELADKPEWFKRQVAGVGDMLSMINNAAANNAYLRTAFTRQAVQDWCYLIGYELPDAKTASGMILFYLNPDRVTFPISITRDELTATTKGSVATNSRRFEARQDITYNGESYECFNNLIADNAILINRDCVSGERVRLSGQVPAGTQAGIDYYVIRVSGNQIKLAKTAQDTVFNRFIPLTPGSAGSGFFTVTFYSVRVTCFQQERKTDISLGISDGIKQWQEYDFPDTGILRETLSVTVGGEPWKRVDFLTFSNPIDQHYQHIYTGERKSYIRFGNGEYGAIPSNFPVMAEYAVGGGQDSNVRQIGAVSNYAGSSQVINGCFNATEMSGGSDPQAIEVAKRIAPGVLRTADRFITASDGEALAIAHGGISLVHCVRNFYGALSCKIVAIATGGGNPDLAHRNELAAFLASKTIMESIDIHTDLSELVPHNVVSSAHIAPTYQWDDIFPIFRLAWKLFFTETSKEILDQYLSEGIEKAVETINYNLGESFSTTNYSDIEPLLLALDQQGTRSYGETIQESAVYTFIQANIKAIDYMNIEEPAFPLMHREYAISTIGTLNLTRIM